MTQTDPADTSSPEGLAPEGKPCPAGDRRSFVAKLVAVVSGGAALLVPLASGLVVFLGPLWRKARSPQVRVALLSQVPEDGIPRFFPVRADRVDAWNRYPQQRVGGVYLLREKGQEPIALTAKCPHAGCFIGYVRGSDVFQCPCHTSTFHLDGARVHGDAEVSPRDMDRLPVELKPVGSVSSSGVSSSGVSSSGVSSSGVSSSGAASSGAVANTDAPSATNSAEASGQDAEIWVEYIEFQTGHKEKIRAV